MRASNSEWQKWQQQIIRELGVSKQFDSDGRAIYECSRETMRHHSS
ncbi:hypothetical protein AWB81_07361 [Caballeronia arationis]|nr:hypothetical protein AWB81_07361 [Caballeronia arationis]